MNDFRDQTPFDHAVRLLNHAVLLSLGYYVCGVIGTVMTVPPADFAIVWPATAVILAAFLVTPPRNWWIYVPAVLLTHLFVVWSVQFTPIRIEVALTQVAGNLGIASVSAAVLRWTDIDALRFDTFKGVFLFILLACVAVPLAGNGLVLSVHLQTGWTDNFWLSWRQWAMASIYPTVTITPLLVLAFQRRLLPAASRLALAEGSAICTAVFGIAFLVFGHGLWTPNWPTLLLVPLPFLVWSAVRQGVGGTCLSLLAFGSAIIVQALRGVGPFAENSSIEGVVSLQVFLTAVSVSLVLLAALMEDSRRTEELLRLSQGRLDHAAASTDTGLWQWDQRTRQLWTTEHCRTMFNLPPQAVPSLETFLRAIHADDRHRVRKAWSSALSDGASGMVEFRVPGVGGDVRWMITQASAERDSAGAIIRINGVLRDVTQRVTAQQEVERLTRRLFAVQDEERKSITRELYDSTAQYLVASRMILHSLRKQTVNAADKGTLMDAVMTSLNDAISELRSFSLLLRPHELDEMGLCDAMTNYVEVFGKRTGLQMSIEATPLAELLPTDYKHAMFRVVMESLANVHRHADATRVSIKLRHRASYVHLIISDDGRGMQREMDIGEGDILPLGAGIPGMSARIRQLGGSFAVRSGATGSRVHAALPFSVVSADHGARELHAVAL